MNIQLEKKITRIMPSTLPSGPCDLGLPLCSAVNTVLDPNIYNSDGEISVLPFSCILTLTAEGAKLPKGKHARTFLVLFLPTGCTQKDPNILTVQELDGVGPIDNRPSTD